MQHYFLPQLHVCLCSVMKSFFWGGFLDIHNEENIHENLYLSPEPWIIKGDNHVRFNLYHNHVAGFHNQRRPNVSYRNLENKDVSLSIHVIDFLTQYCLV